jgi:2-polyprenyl-3-methyl-5-hydroxy-6-metoxy-1,4-benzoquinol methylase
MATIDFSHFFPPMRALSEAKSPAIAHDAPTQAQRRIWTTTPGYIRINSTHQFLSERQYDRLRRNLAHGKRRRVSVRDRATAARRNGAGSGADDFRLAYLRFPLMMTARAQPRLQGGEAQMARAVEAWDDRWTTPEGRADWLVPHPAVTALVPVLKARGAEHVLDLGCGVGRHALLFAEHGFAVEGIDGAAARA